MARKSDNIWIRLKRAFRRMVLLPQRGDGGIISDKTLMVTKQQKDSTSVIKDTIVIVKPSK